MCIWIYSMCTCIYIYIYLYLHVCVCPYVQHIFGNVYTKHATSIVSYHMPLYFAQLWEFGYVILYRKAAGLRVSIFRHPWRIYTHTYTYITSYPCRFNKHPLACLAKPETFALSLLQANFWRGGWEIWSFEKSEASAWGLWEPQNNYGVHHQKI